ncbi:YraN family protein [Actinophytocola sp.]|uniref:YraN family protein n=1 Tax=Actinophytocola sp. TaxID=1872138 RepID=UPI00389A1270
MTATTKPAKAKHLVTGARGEALAARYLEEQGLTVLSKNWRCNEGELDLVLTDGHILVVCEVKTRTSDNYGGPAEAVDNAKAGRIRRLARQWRVQNGVAHVVTRYDIVAILWPSDGEPQINHLRGVL